jgi:hypothetical protein
MSHTNYDRHRRVLLRVLMRVLPASAPAAKSPSASSVHIKREETCTTCLRSHPAKNIVTAL